MDPMRNDITALQHGVRLHDSSEHPLTLLYREKTNRDSAGIIIMGPVFGGWNLMQMLVILEAFPDKNLDSWLCKLCIVWVGTSWWPPQCDIHYQCTRLSGFEVHNFNMVFKLPSKTLKYVHVILDPGKLRWHGQPAIWRDVCISY